MTIPKNTNRAKQAITNARDIRCYSLSNNFSGQPLTEKPTVWGGAIVDGHRYRDLLTVTQSEFLAHELEHGKLSVSTEGRYTLQIHSNLWYEFIA